VGPYSTKKVTLDSLYWKEIDYQESYEEPSGYIKNFYPEIFCNNLAIYSEGDNGIAIEEIVIYANTKGIRTSFHHTFIKLSFSLYYRD